MSGRSAAEHLDREFMEQTLALGALGEGRTSPNPRVGCLLVRDGKVVGRGYHRAVGLPHAEAHAVVEAGPLAHGATAYVNLEPCAHEGRTPPCADLLVASGVRRVVAALQDPNPMVDGQGFARLRAAGVAVDVGLLAEEAEELNEAFLLRHREGRPLVTLKAALSLDGMLSAGAGRSQWITGEPARRFAHRLRLAHDAVLVGAQTVRRDDPSLTVRLPGVDAPGPLRVVLSRGLDLDPGARVFEGSPTEARRTRLYTGEGGSGPRADALSARAHVVRVSENAGQLALAEVLSDLVAAGVQSLLVEGGGRTLASFLEAGLADRAALFYASRLLGARGGTPLVDRESVEQPELGWRLERVRQLALGEDLLFLGRLRAGAGNEA